MESRKLISLFILAVVSVVVSAKTCPDKYSRFSPQHSFCAERNSKCNVIKEGVGKDDIKDVLAIHNTLRSKVASGKESGLPTAANMQQMEWDQELASIAQSWASQCVFNHDCNECRRVGRFKVGQNIAIQSSTCSSSDCIKADWNGRIEKFYSEVKDFNKKYNSPFQYNSAYGHFTQVVWAESSKVGCGFVAYKEGEFVKRLYVCNYGTAANLPGASVYKEGKPCSACPSNTCCGCKKSGSTYPGLCSDSS